MVVVIFEGLQGVGKTTLIKAVERQKFLTNAQLKRPISKTLSEYPKVNQEYTQRCAKELKMLAYDKNVYAVDRFIGSEFVFGNVCHRHQDYHWLWNIDTELSQLPVFTVHVTAPRNFMEQHIWARRGQYTAELYIEKLLDASILFEQYFKRTRIPFIEFKNESSVDITVAKDSQFKQSIALSAERLIESLKKLGVGA